MANTVHRDEEEYNREYVSAARLQKLPAKSTKSVQTSANWTPSWHKKTTYVTVGAMELAYLWKLVVGKESAAAGILCKA